MAIGTLSDATVLSMQPTQPRCPAANIAFVSTQTWSKALYCTNRMCCYWSAHMLAARACAVQGPNDHTIAQIKDAVRDGLRAVKNTLDDGAVVPGAGAFEVAAAQHLRSTVKKSAQVSVAARTCPMLARVRLLLHCSQWSRLPAVTASWLHGLLCRSSCKPVIAFSYQSGTPIVARVAPFDVLCTSTIHSCIQHLTTPCTHDIACISKLPCVQC